MLNICQKHFKNIIRLHFEALLLTQSIQHLFHNASYTLLLQYPYLLSVNDFMYFHCTFDEEVIASNEKKCFLAQMLYNENVTKHLFTYPSLFNHLESQH